jgi:histone arginine demethylase JMJD6
VKFEHRRTHGELWRCKKGKRTDIKPSDWDKFGYALNDEPLTRPIVYDEQTRPIPRVKRKDITPEWFYENAAKPHQPIIVEGVTDDWPAMHNWSIDAMEERFRNVAFKVAKDDKGKKLRTKFKYYADYIRKQQDDSPLYLFETNVDDNAHIRPLRDDYKCPDIFPQDWMNLVNEDARPPHRWFCIGPKRSGTTVHTDPLSTAAWNVITHGQKHWVLMDPKESKKVVKGKDLLKKGEDDEAIMYFDFILPRIKKAYPDLKIMEGLQNPGEVIFVPGDWWHGVVNTQDCVAITQNYCGPDNFEQIWDKTRKEREKVAHLWLRNMRKFAPQLAERALEMNKRDNFKMRHERPAGDRLPDADSSSSESSSDSSSDDAGDLSETGLQDVLPKGTRLGRKVWSRSARGKSDKPQQDAPKDSKKRRISN